MPEWTIQRIRRISGAAFTDDKKNVGRFFILGSDETNKDFILDGKMVLCRINSILNREGGILATLGKEILLECRTLYLPFNDTSDTYIPGAKYDHYFVLLFTHDFVKEYGLRTNEYVDITILGSVDPSKSNEVKELIYPRRFVKGRMSITPSGNSVKDNITEVDQLILQNLEGELYNDLIQEINRSYSYGLYRATSILIRKLFENLLVDLLRTRFGMSRIELFFKGGRLLDFSDLIENLKSEKNQFTPITSGFDQKFFEFINSLRETSNANAHALESYMDKKHLDEEKTQMNHYIKVINNTIKTIKASNV